jgi:RHS repeat-associated protein
MSVTGAVLKTEIGHGPVLATDYTVMESTIHDTVGRATSTTISGVENKTTYDDTVTGTGKPRNTQQSLRDSLFAAYDSAGNITKTINGSDTVRSVYDAMGRKTNEIIPIAPIDRDWKYEGLKTTYTNHNGWKTVTIVNPSKGTVTQNAIKPNETTASTTVELTTYSNGASKSASNFIGGNLQAAYNIEYDTEGQASNQTTQLGALPGQIHAFTYDAGAFSTAGRTATRKVSVGTTSLLSTTTQFDPLGRVDSVRETPSASTGLKPKSVDFVYKGAFLDEVLRYNNSDLTGPSISNTKYQYASNRKIASITHSANGISSSIPSLESAVQYDRFDRVISINGQSISRDQTGEVLTERTQPKIITVSSTVFGVDGQGVNNAPSYGRVTQDSSSRYQYDAEGNVVKQWRIDERPQSTIILNKSSLQNVTESAARVDADRTLTFTATTGWHQLRLEPLRVESTDTWTRAKIDLTLKINDGSLLYSIFSTITKTIEADMVSDGKGGWVLPVQNSWDVYIPKSNYQYSLTMKIRLDRPSTSTTAPWAISGSCALEAYGTYSQYTYDNANRLTSACQFTMDPANSAAIVPTQFLSKIYYAYDALGNRIGLTAYDINGDKVEDRSFVFENGRVLLEYDKRDRLERERFYAMGSGELLAINDLDYEGTSQTVSNSERIWTLLDYQGSVANLYASSSRFLATSYDPFGRLTRSTDVGNDVSLRDAVPTGYLGMDFDPETLLYIEGGRPYDPAAGRYLTAGSMAAGTYNIYAFANNTPVDRSVRDVRGAGMQGIVGGSPIGAGTGAFFGSIGGSLSCIGNGVVQPFLNYYDFGRTLIDAGAELVGYHWNHESVSDMGQAAESGTTMLQLEMALLKGLGTNVADTVTIGGYATYQYRNGDINDSEYGDRILGVGLNFAGGAGLLKAAGLGKVTVAQASIGGVRAISTSVGRVVDVARKIEFNPQAITQVYSGIPVNMLRWKKVAEGFGMAAESIAPNRTLPVLSEAFQLTDEAKLASRMMTKAEWKAFNRAERLGRTAESWSTTRQNTWIAVAESELANSTGRYSRANIRRMVEGLAPRVRAEVTSNKTGLTTVREISMELHHRSLPQRFRTPTANEAWNLEPVYPWSHQGMDPFRHTGYRLERIINGTNSF